MKKPDNNSSGDDNNERTPSGSGPVGPSEVEESSPDLLQNTPSNIARLEDEIEHCKGRQKYLARTKSPSDGEDVRWYFCKVPLPEKKLSASVPQTEVVGKSDYFRFSMRDSLALEVSFLQREEELLSYWWKEYAECSEGPSGLSVPAGYGADELYVIEEERVGVPVKGGLYEVSNQLNRLYAKFLKRNPGYDGKVSIYAHSLGSVLSYDILCHQENLWAPSPMDSVYVNYEDKKSQVNPTWKSVASNSTLSDDNNSVTSKSDTEQLPYSIEEDRYKSDVRSMVHEFNTVNSIATADVQEDCADNSTSINHEGVAQRPLDGVQNNSTLQLFEKNTTIGWLSMDTTEEKKYNPKSHASIRSVEVNTVMGAEIIDKDNLITILVKEVKHLRARISELEQMHPSMIFHNKEAGGTNEGCEVNAEQATSISPSPKEDVPRKMHTPYIKYTKLGFKVDTFFAVGSPLGVFLALRNIRIGIGKGRNYWQDEEITEEMPCCRQMFNIFHPFDPVAYRIEPLVCKEYISKRPVIIPYHRGGKRLHIGFQEFREDITARSQAIASHMKLVKAKVANVFKPRSKDYVEDCVEDIQGKERSYGSLMIEKVTGSEDGHIDHVLQEKTFQHPYISALGAHTNYWRDYDTALFIIEHLYRDIPEDPYEQSIGEGSSRSQRGPITLLYEKDSLDEDLPLTFSDSSLVREFSRKARRAISTSSL